MNIVSAQYVVDDEGNNASIQVTDDKGNIHFAPVNGATWLNGELNAWVAAGNKILAAA